MAGRRHAGRDGARRDRRAGRRRSLCGAINGAIVIYGRLQPIVTTIATGAVYFGIALLLRPFPGGSVNEDLADALTGRVFGVVPASLVVLFAVVLIVWVPFSRSVPAAPPMPPARSEAAAYMSGVPIRRGKFVAYALAGLLAAIGGLFLTFFTYTGEAAFASGNTYTLFSIAAVVLGGVSLFGGKGSAIGAIFGALGLPHHRRPVVRVRFRSAVAAAVPGRRAAGRRQPRRVRAVPRAQPAGVVPMSETTEPGGDREPACRGSCARSIRRWRRLSPASSLLLFFGSLYSTSFLSPEYLLQQLKVASFLGVIATGMMLVILLGQIDLSVPWVVAVGGMMSSRGRGLRHRAASILAIPFGIFCGVLIGLVNGVGVAYLRIPSMIITLATNAVAQGLMVVYTGGFSPQDSASRGDALSGDRLLCCPACRTPSSSGRCSARRRSSCSPARRSAAPIYAIGNRERAAYPVGHRHAPGRDDRLCHLRRA